jgi:GST-like protein
MLKFYYSGARNPTKIALMLEETGLPYEPIAVDTRKGDQHKRSIWRSIRTPRCRRSSTATRVWFDSSAILLYLGEKTGKFMPAKTRQGARRIAVVDDVRRLRRRALFRPVGALPGLRAGKASLRDQPLRLRGAAPFRHHRSSALAKNKYMLGDTYTIVDMNVWGWARPDAERARRRRVGQVQNLKR